MMASVRRLPVVVVLGATGTGKSKLAIQLGRRFNGEIISADSMQIYQGLDIITNKVTEEEQRQCQHHLISYVNPFTSSTNTVVDFRNVALPVMDTLLAKEKLPIVVGGTNYYIESLLWNFLIDKQIAEGVKDESSAAKKSRTSEAGNQDPDCVQKDAGSPVSDAASSEHPSGQSSTHPSGPPPENPSKLSSGDSATLSAGLSSEHPSGLTSAHHPSGHSLAHPSGLSATHLSRLAHDGKDPDCVQVREGGDSSASGDSSGMKTEEVQGTTDGTPTQSSELEGSCQDRKEGPGGGDSTTSPDRREKFRTMQTVELHRQLSEVDPVSAQRLHPHNRRKIIRALEVCEEHGVPMSSIYKRQHASVGDHAVSGPLRFTDTCIFWIQCDQPELDNRLDARVDGMLEQGLLKELHDFHEQYKQEVSLKHRDPDYTVGIFQSIGFKEFHDYLLLPAEERDTVKGRQLLEEGIAALKLATRQYARRQIKWIKNRFLKRPGPNVPPVYGLNSTDVSHWDEHVFTPASQILTQLVQGEPPDEKPLTLEGESTKFVQNVCDVCGGRVFTTELEWKSHLAGRRHKNALYSQRKRLSKSAVTNNSNDEHKIGDKMDREENSSKETVRELGAS